MASRRAQRRRAESHGRRVSFLGKFRACRKKNHFPNRDMAEEAMASLMRSPYYDGKPLNTYLCPCGEDHYHFGHLTNRPWRTA